MEEKTELQIELSQLIPGKESTNGLNDIFGKVLRLNLLEPDKDFFYVLKDLYLRWKNYSIDDSFPSSILSVMVQIDLALSKDFFKSIITKRHFLTYEEKKVLVHYVEGKLKKKLINEILTVFKEKIKSIFGKNKKFYLYSDEINTLNIFPDEKILSIKRELKRIIQIESVGYYPKWLIASKLFDVDLIETRDFALKVLKKNKTDYVLRDHLVSWLARTSQKIPVLNKEIFYPYLDKKEKEKFLSLKSDPVSTEVEKGKNILYEDDVFNDYETILSCRKNINQLIFKNFGCDTFRNMEYEHSALLIGINKISFISFLNTLRDLINSPTDDFNQFEEIKIGGWKNREMPSIYRKLLSVLNCNIIPQDFENIFLLFELSGKKIHESSYGSGVRAKGLLKINKWLIIFSKKVPTLSQTVNNHIGY